MDKEQKSTDHFSEFGFNLVPYFAGHGEIFSFAIIKEFHYHLNINFPKTVYFKE